MDLRLRSLYIPSLRLQVQRHPFNFKYRHSYQFMHPSTPTCSHCLHLSTTQAFVRDPYDFCNKQPSRPDTALPNSPSQLPTRVSCAVRTEPSHKRQRVSFDDILRLPTGYLLLSSTVRALLCHFITNSMHMTQFTHNAAFMNMQVSIN